MTLAEVVLAAPMHSLNPPAGEPAALPFPRHHDLGQGALPRS
jgi:hypothetical protein